MAKLQKSMNAAVIISEFSHVFCCGLPAFFSLLSLLSGIGMTTIMPAALENFHHTIHDWEVPMLMGSGVILVLGWVLHQFSKKMDCATDGCSHPPCGPVKTRSNKLLLFATILYAGNVIFYLAFHAGHVQ